MLLVTVIYPTTRYLLPSVMLVLFRYRWERPVLYRIVIWTVLIDVLVIDSDIHLVDVNCIDEMVKSNFTKDWNEYYCIGQTCCRCGNDVERNLSHIDRSCCGRDVRFSESLVNLVFMPFLVLVKPLYFFVLLLGFLFFHFSLSFVLVGLLFYYSDKILIWSDP